jgi:hypothetical protein
MEFLKGVIATNTMVFIPPFEEITQSAIFELKQGLMLAIMLYNLGLF